MALVRNAFNHTLAQCKPIEIINILYLLFTTIYILCLYQAVERANDLLLARGIILIITITLISLHTRFDCKLLDVLRTFYPIALTGYWYPETFYLNNHVLVPNLDFIFDQLDWTLFSCSPATVFSVHFPQAWIAELMYFGYFFYYVLVAFTCISAYVFDANKQRTPFIMLCTFLIFYTIFIFVPVAGPQFHYPPDQCFVPEGYWFAKIIVHLQETGEKATGAFPSSHVGVSLVAMYLIFKQSRVWFYIFLPVVCFLVAATVYIKAHYLVDVLGAFLLTPLIYCLSVWCWKRVMSISVNQSIST